MFYVFPIVLYCFAYNSHIISLSGLQVCQKLCFGSLYRLQIQNYWKSEKYNFFYCFIVMYCSRTIGLDYRQTGNKMILNFAEMESWHITDLNKGSFAHGYFFVFKNYFHLGVNIYTFVSVLPVTLSPFGYMLMIAWMDTNMEIFCYRYLLESVYFQLSILHHQLLIIVLWD